VPELPLPTLGFLLALLVLLTAWFSCTETALMSVNRQRLRHRAREGSAAAKLAEQLLERPDRLIGVVLICRNFAKVAAAAIVTLIAFALGGTWPAAIAVVLFVAALIVVGEVAPKTLGALYPEPIALPAAVVYTALLKVLDPVVWGMHGAAHGLLRLVGVTRETARRQAIGSEELRTVVAEASAVIPHGHQRMLMSILDLEKVAVEDIMVPRHEISGIDVSDDWDVNVARLRESRHTRMPVYDGNLESLIGVLHMKQVARLLAREEFDLEHLIALAKAREPYYVPEGTTLNTQLLQFQRQDRRIAFVVDEYGDVQGLLTLEDLLEEIVGDFTSGNTHNLHKDVHRERGGEFVVNAAASVRTLNRKMGWSLPASGPRTLNGLIVEQLETIPGPGARLRLGGYSLEILQVTDNAVKTVRLRPVPQQEADGG
jgi:Mg2+/Co2+ transporter CorB